jgi:FlaG/FlaF family flagellin (archaellin)
MTSKGGEGRAATPIVGNILLVAIVLVIAVTLVTLSFAFLEETGTPTADAAFEYRQTPAGLEMTPKALGTDVTVQLNGEQITTFAADTAGKTALVPTAPGDTITVISRDEDRSVLVNREIDDRSEIGDFIAYYTFGAGSGGTLEDRSNNGNEGTVNGATWGQDGRDSYLAFDGNDDNVTVNDINAPEGTNNNVTEFTVAVSYSPENSTNQRELIEHKDGNKNWFITTRWNKYGNGNDPEKYSPEFKTGPGGGCTNCIKGGTYNSNETHVIVGTYDGTESKMYVDGARVGTKTGFQQEISMGNMKIGQDAESNYQHYDGKIYEIRLYYHVLDQQEVEAVTKAMP